MKITKRVICAIMILILTASASVTAGAETVTEDFGKNNPIIENAYDTNMTAVNDVKNGETFFCVQKSAQPGSGYITYSFKNQKITDFSFRMYYMEGFLYAGMDNRYAAYALVENESEYRKIELKTDIDEGVIIENGAYSVTSAVACPSSELPENTVAVKIVVDPQKYGYVPYTIRIKEITVETEDHEHNAVIPTEDDSAYFRPGEEKTVKRNGFSETRYASFTSSNGKNYHYSVALPDNFDENKEYPLLMYLHGLGGDTLFTVYENFLESVFRKNECIVIAPIAYMAEEDFWVDYSAVAEGLASHTLCSNYTQSKYEMTDALRFAIELYASYCEKYNVIRSFIVGYSMGAYGTWDLITRCPGLFDAAVPVSGAGDASKGEILKDQLIWAFHGNADATVDYMGTKNMYDAVLAVGGEKMKYTEYEGGDHGICYLAYNESLPWLFGEVTEKTAPYKHKVDLGTLFGSNEETSEEEASEEGSEEISGESGKVPEPTSEEEPKTGSKPGKWLLPAVAAISAAAAAAAVIIIKKKKK